MIVVIGLAYLAVAVAAARRRSHPGHRQPPRDRQRDRSRHRVSTPAYALLFVERRARSRGASSSCRGSRTRAVIARPPRARSHIAVTEVLATAYVRVDPHRVALGRVDGTRDRERRPQLPPDAVEMLGERRCPRSARCSRRPAAANVVDATSAPARCAGAGGRRERWQRRTRRRGPQSRPHPCKCGAGSTGRRTDTARHARRPGRQGGGRARGARPSRRATRSPTSTCRRRQAPVSC